MVHITHYWGSKQTYFSYSLHKAYHLAEFQAKLFFKPNWEGGFHWDTVSQSFVNCFLKVYRFLKYLTKNRLVNLFFLAYLPVREFGTKLFIQFHFVTFPNIIGEILLDNRNHFS